MRAAGQWQLASQSVSAVVKVATPIPSILANISPIFSQFWEKLSYKMKMMNHNSMNRLEVSRKSSFLGCLPRKRDWKEVEKEGCVVLGGRLPYTRTADRTKNSLLGHFHLNISRNNDCTVMLSVLAVASAWVFLRGLACFVENAIQV